MMTTIATSFNVGYYAPVAASLFSIYNLPMIIIAALLFSGGILTMATRPFGQGRNNKSIGLSFMLLGAAIALFPLATTLMSSPQ